MKNDEKRGVSKRTVAILLALVLVIGCAVGGTLAWLTAQTSEVKNTFTPSDISITLTEDNPTNNTAKMIPGWTIAKDPKVTVKAGSEACWLFVQIDKSDNYDTYLNEYTVSDGWTQGKGTDGVPTNVYYRSITAQTTADTSFNILAGKDGYSNGYVTVKENVTKDNMNALTVEGATQPTLTFTAYACQYYKDNTTPFGVGAAWKNAEAQQTTPTP